MQHCSQVFLPLEVLTKEVSQRWKNKIIPKKIESQYRPIIEKYWKL
jgi:hypothetical protein